MIAVAGINHLQFSAINHCTHTQRIPAVANAQLTWLRRDKELRWIFREDRPDPERTAEEILGELERE